MKTKNIINYILVINSIQLSAAIYFLGRVLVNGAALFSFTGLFAILWLNAFLCLMDRKRVRWQKVICLLSVGVFTALYLHAYSIAAVNPLVGVGMWVATFGVILSNTSAVIERLLIVLEKEKEKDNG